MNRTKVKTAQAEERRQQPIQYRTLIGQRSEEHRKRSQNRAQQNDSSSPEAVGYRTEQRLQRCAAHSNNSGDPPGFGDIQAGQCFINRPDAHAHEVG